MTRERYVLLGLAQARSPWFRTVGSWATAASIPAEFVRCASVEELRARLRSGRRFSALLIDATAHDADRDLFAEARAYDCAVVVVDGSVEAARDWPALGASGVLAPDFGRDDLLDLLERCATMVGAAVVGDPVPAASAARPTGTLVAVTGTGGSGASTVAIALAEGFAQGPEPGGRRGAGSAEPERPTVLLADFCRAADQAMLHDSRVVVPGLQEVVEAHRSGAPDASTLREQTFEVGVRGYRLLLGLRRAQHWATIRPRAFEATLDSLQSAFDVVVADVDPDAEGEAETGSIEVEERHLLTRASLARADAVLIVGMPTMKGMFALVRLASELLAFGVPPERLLPVLNRAPRSPRARGELNQAFGELVSSGAALAADRLLPPIYLPERRVDNALRDGALLPKPLAQVVTRAATAVVERAGPAVAMPSGVPQPIAPGSLSGFSPQDRPSP